ncbi:MAG: cytochrome c3 family protein [bacterium]
MLKLLREFGQAIWEVFKLPFFLVAEGFMRLFAIGWRKLVMLFVAAVILTFVVLIGFFETTSQPGFCGSCHLMEPYIAAWKTSSHADVPCMKCHARQGLSGFLETKFTALSMLVNYATGIYKRSKPWAEIEDTACLQCHETRLLEGKIETKLGVHFDHTPHLTEVRRGRRLRCTSCHSQIVQGEHISITPTTCFLCHFKNLDEKDRAKLSRCTLCHDAPTGEHAKERNVFDHGEVVKGNVDCVSCHQPMWQGQGTVRKERCGACHSETDHIDRFNDLEFLHEWHIEKRKVDCERCHDPIEHKQPPLEQVVSGECNACHSDPHSPMLAVYKGEGSRLLPEKQPATMYTSGVACFSCHKGPTNGMGEARIGENACLPCHKANYLNLARNWQKAYASRIERLEPALRKASGNPRIEDARHDVALIRRGGAWHNPLWAGKVLDAVEGVLKKSGLGGETVTIPAASQGCLACHNGIETVIVESPFSAFNHARHLNTRGIACTQCHVQTDPEDPSHGRRLPVERSCASCHHSARNANDSHNCIPCHKPSRRLYTGNLPGMEASPSPMAENEMACVDCHVPDQAYAPPNGEFCLNCHEPAVVESMDFSRGKLRAAVGKLKGTLDDAQMIIRMDPGRAVHNPDLAEKILSGKH